MELLLEIVCIQCTFWQPDHIHWLDYYTRITWKEQHVLEINSEVLNNYKSMQQPYTACIVVLELLQNQVEMNERL